MTKICPRAVDPASAVVLTDLLFTQATALGPNPFLHARTQGKSGSWTTVTFAEAGDRALRIAAGLRSLGIKPGDRVGIVSENRPEWLIADHAVMAAGGISVPAYTTNTEDDHHYILADSGAAAVIVSTAGLARALLPAVARVDTCRHVISMEPLATDQVSGFTLHAWDDLLGHEPAMPHAGKRTDTACIIYTSGTGGAPKGVMLSHGAILSNCEGIEDLFRNAGLDEEVFLSFLPLSHSYEHTAGQFFPISIGAEIYYAVGTDTIAQDMADMHPTVMTAVPRLYEAFKNRVSLGLRRASPLRQKLFARTLALGRKRYEDPGSLTLWERIQDGVLERLVRDKVRARFGGRLKFMISGGAPLNPEVGVFFLALGIQILQGYGQTESAPVVSCNPPEKIKIETVGPPMEGVECRIAEDGEILVRGELVMQGYWQQPDATSETVVDGWLHTGDIGEFDADGYLRITERKKDIIVNSGGDNISPQRVEGFLVLEPEISQAMVLGDTRPHLVALIVPEEGMEAGGEDTRAAVAAAIERVNAGLAPIERVRRFMIADEPFTVENGQMTPTMKVRRHIVTGIYRERLEALYRA
ncbi:MAG: long-chain fatty acid--CoA ligase [Alphaproteobacteria bacterium]|nr:long-chain fatty acid--CoA ligase [Alphaproteobacteria bacterium]